MRTKFLKRKMSEKMKKLLAKRAMDMIRRKAIEMEEEEKHQHQRGLIAHKAFSKKQLKK